MRTLTTALLLIIVLQSRVHSADAEKTLKHSEVSVHNTAASCWIIIDQKVYDITAYLEPHAAQHKESLAEWCGKEASVAWKTKGGMGRAHKPKAQLLLQKYLLGQVED